MKPLSMCFSEFIISCLSYIWDILTSFLLYTPTDLPCLCRKEVWATFPKQDEAVRFAKTHPKVHVFSYQDHLNGQRRFLVSTYEEFWRRLFLFGSYWSCYFYVIAYWGLFHFLRTMVSGTKIWTPDVVITMK